MNVDGKGKTREPPGYCACPLPIKGLGSFVVDGKGKSPEPPKEMVGPNPPPPWTPVSYEPPSPPFTASVGYCSASCTSSCTARSSVYVGARGDPGILGDRAWDGAHGTPHQRLAPQQGLGGQISNRGLCQCG